MAADGPGRRGTGFDPLQVFETLADIDHHALDLRPVMLDEPGNRDGSVEPTGIGERDLTGCSHVSFSPAGFVRTT